MERLEIKRTKYTFGINFDADSGHLLIEGSSYPENAIAFFQPIHDWLKTYIHDVGRPLQVDLKIEYLNTSSSKCILDFLETLNQFHHRNGFVTVKWYYEKDDDDMLETGEEFGEDVDFPFERIAV